MPGVQRSWRARRVAAQGCDVAEYFDDPERFGVRLRDQYAHGCVLNVVVVVVVVFPETETRRSGAALAGPDSSLADRRALGFFFEKPGGPGVSTSETDAPPKKTRRLRQELRRFDFQRMAPLFGRPKSFSFGRRLA